MFVITKTTNEIVKYKKNYKSIWLQTLVDLMSYSREVFVFLSPYFVGIWICLFLLLTPLCIHINCPAPHFLFNSHGIWSIRASQGFEFFPAWLRQCSAKKYWKYAPWNPIHEKRILPGASEQNNAWQHHSTMLYLRMW